MKKFAAVRTAYYKDQALTKDVKKSVWLTERQSDGSSKRVRKTTVIKKRYKSAIAEIEHITRVGTTQSVNVFDEFSDNNTTVTLKSSNGLLDAYFKLKNRYQATTGRKCRSDMNTLFEHIIVLSDDYVIELEKQLGFEKAQFEINKCIKEYCKSFSEEFGFAQVGFSVHLDEGRFETNEKGEKHFKRNYHCHALFFNYDFKNKCSNLKNLSKKGTNPQTGKTNELNPHFERIQTLLSEKFMRLGFERGVSKLITKAEHLSKYDFILKKNRDEVEKLRNITDEVQQQINNVIEYLAKWLKSLFFSPSDSEIYADLTVESLFDIESDQIRERLKKIVNDNEVNITNNSELIIKKEDLISQKIKNKK